ncbi:hypothetical protein CEB3_c00590 [Peptococcaceae bacterium CEB3]|nr:hypothetical protein CEB3_c00590 [Peptococcaceae bacterium CEB3]
MVNCSEDHPSDGDNGSLLSTPLSRALMPDSVVRVVLRFDSSVGNPDEGGLEVNPSSRDAYRFLLAGRFIVARRVKHAQQQSRLEDVKWVMSVPILEMIVMAEVRSTPTPGMVQSSWIAFS